MLFNDKYIDFKNEQLINVFPMYIRSYETGWRFDDIFTKLSGQQYVQCGKHRTYLSFSD
jgi:hypothetical protein